MFQLNYHHNFIKSINLFMEFNLRLGKKYLAIILFTLRNKYILNNSKFIGNIVHSKGHQF